MHKEKCITMVLWLQRSLRILNNTSQGIEELTKTTSLENKRTISCSLIQPAVNTGLLNTFIAIGSTSSFITFSS